MQVLYINPSRKYDINTITCTSHPLCSVYFYNILIYPSYLFKFALSFLKHVVFMSMTSSRNIISLP